MSLLSRANFVKTLVLLAALAGNFWLSASAKADTIDFSRYAAVAFSTSTGEYGYGWDQPSRGAAEQVALANCKATDAKIVGWVQGGWLVLAIGRDDATYGVGWEWGDGANSGDAADTARDNCNERGQKVKTYVVICSGNINPRVYK